MEALAWIPFSQLIWLVAVDYERTRQEFVYLSEAAVSTGLASKNGVSLPLSRYQPGVMRCINDCLVETVSLSAGAEKVLTAKPPDLVVVCEPGLIEGLYHTNQENRAGQDILQLIEGRLIERRGRGWFSGTSDNASEDWFQLWSRWAGEGNAFLIPTWENVVRFPKGQDETRLKKYLAEYGEEMYMAHFGGVPSSPSGLVLHGYYNPAQLVNAGIGYDSSKTVEIAIDPNYSMGNRYSVLAIQEEWPFIDVVDEVAVEGKTHDEVRALCMARPWWSNVIGGVIDPFAGDAHPFGSYAPVHYWRPVPLRTQHRPRVATTVQALKEAMMSSESGTQRLRISSSCKRLLWEMVHWKQEGRMGVPGKKNCDALKALGYYLVDKFYRERTIEPDEDNVVLDEYGNAKPSYTAEWEFSP